MQLPMYNSTSSSHFLYYFYPYKIGRAQNHSISPDFLCLFLCLLSYSGLVLLPKLHRLVPPSDQSASSVEHADATRATSIIIRGNKEWGLLCSMLYVSRSDLLQKTNYKVIHGYKGSTRDNPVITFTNMLSLVLVGG